MTLFDSSDQQNLSAKILHDATEEFELEIKSVEAELKKAQDTRT